MEIKKRHFYNEQHYTIDKERRIVKLNDELHNKLFNKELTFGKNDKKFGYKKVGGSSLGNITGSNPYGSHFEESLRIMWLNMPMFEEKYVKAGIAVEPKVIKEIENLLGFTLDTYPGEKYDFDFFKEHEFIGGLPDGTSPNVTYEIKTTGIKNKRKWDTQGVPEYYKQQVSLYDYLLGGKGETYIVATFLNAEDYKNPNAVAMPNKNIKFYTVKYDSLEVKRWIDMAKKFRDGIVNSGQSYPYGNEIDPMLLSYLECKNEDEYIAWYKKNILKEE